MKLIININKMDENVAAVESNGLPSDWVPNRREMIYHVLGRAPCLIVCDLRYFM